MKVNNTPQEKEKAAIARDIAHAQAECSRQDMLQEVILREQPEIKRTVHSIRTESVRRAFTGPVGLSWVTAL